MTRSKIDVVLRSDETEEISLGVYDFKYTLIKNIPADVITTSIGLSDATSINKTQNSSVQFSFIFRNDATDRVNRIYYIIYKNRMYSVVNIQPYAPRVRITVGDWSGIDYEKLGIQNG